MDEVVDANELRSLETQIMEFGQTPSQLFRNPHPSRDGSVPMDLPVPPMLDW